MTKFKITYFRTQGAGSEVVEEVDAHYFTDAGEWIDFKQGAGATRDAQVLRVRADKVRRIDGVS